MTATESQALVRAPVASLQSNLLRPVARPTDLIEAHRAAVEVIREALQEGRDYGRIPGTPKPALLKPGAERLTIAFGLRTDVEVMEKEIDHERRVEWTSRKGERGTSIGLYRYVIRCRLVRADGSVVGEGIGSCSTLETKYVRTPRDCENTVLKMATKRAHVAAVLGTLGLSERFTQDEDVIDAEEHQGEPAPRAPAAPDAAPLIAAIDAEYERLGIGMDKRKAKTLEVLGRKPATQNDLRELLTRLGALDAPLQGELIPSPPVEPDDR